ncbi:putative UPF0481 protein At3g02645 isoform X2 [Nicotiana tabacum]|uniref:UPF0481 protein At3g02645 isoform X2 n=1 Tax=Nicotiana tabacum TaxID=4097 RepID=A0A1S4D0F0_TOBAC|nr:PREDICTED: putative UPF0481 protein At3g02645 isoform X2 [Nicotiana tabacum]
MTTESFINNPETEKRWLIQCTKSFKLDKETAIDFSPYICQVPKTIKESKIQSYIPQKIGLGPYHCFRPEFFVTERHKLTIAKNCMDFSKVQHLITETLIFFEPIIRAQYDKFLDIDTHALCWILTIDSLYLLHFLNSYIPYQEIDSEGRSLAQEKGGDIVEKPMSLMSQLPWDHITGLITKEDENKPQIEEIEIPSVTELEEIAKVKFKLTEGGIRDIKFVEEGSEHTFYLPQITLNSDTEVILRNLVAYEAATASPESSLELAEYVDFMCGIVDTTKDVNILKKANIIKDGSSLNDEEIAELFNGITKTSGKFNKKKSDLEKAIETVNEKFDNTLRVKTYRFIKKYIYTSWKFLTLFSTVLLILLICLQVFCQVYGCSNRWFRTSS